MAELTTLEPISTGDVIDRAVRLYRRNFVPLISVVAVPALIYYASAMMISFGYARTLESAQIGFSPAALLITLLGFAGYLVYLFAILSAVSGMSRAIGDHVMLGDPISFKGCWGFARRRLGDVALMGLMAIPTLMIVGVIAAIVFFVLFAGLAFAIGMGSAIGLPPWVAAIASTLLIIASTLLFVTLILVLAARLVFVPCALMIEGRSSAGAFGRAIQLGGGRTWYRLGVIGLFNYFVTLAILAALIEPLLILFWVNGWSVADLLLHPGWNAVYAAVNQVSALLVWPIWIISFTFLYFDTRVRREGYDIELMTTGIREPAYNYAGGMPVFRPAVLQPAGPLTGAPRQYMQTGPLGLGGYPAAPPISASPPLQTGFSSGSVGEGLEDESHSRDVQGSAAPSPVSDPAWLRPGPEFQVEPGSESSEIQSESAGSELVPGAASPSSGIGRLGPVRCAVCGLEAVGGGKYCIACGDLLQQDGPPGDPS